MGFAAQTTEPRGPDAPNTRSHEILDIARHVFAQKGFEGASMQDLARAVGMSVGNFYRYFPSKNAMIHALIERDIAQVEAQFQEITQAAAPYEAMRAAIRFHVIDKGGLCENAPLWAEMTALTHRTPEIAQMIREAEAVMVGYLLQAIALAGGQSLALVTERFNAHARLLILICKASALHDHLMPEAEREALKMLILTQIDQILAGIMPDPVSVKTKDDFQ